MKPEPENCPNCEASGYECIFCAMEREREEYEQEWEEDSKL